MAPFPRFAGSAFLVMAFLAVTKISVIAAATIAQQISPDQVNVGDTATVTLTVQGGSLNSKQTPTIFGLTISSLDINLPQVDGLQSTLTSTRIMSFNGATSTSAIFSVIPQRSGDFTIPAFDLHTQEGEVLHVKAMKLHVLDGGTSPPANNTVTPPVSPPGSVSVTATVAPFNPNGPVTMPPTNAAPTPAPTAPNNGNPASSTAPDINAPRDPDGTPAKVFIIITPQTTDAYVGQSIPMEIDFYIRMSANWDQNSLPTIKGSDFLMNNFTTRGRVGIGMLENIQYMRETWMTAISAPKSGDFPLSMERDTYYVKSTGSSDPNSFFGNIFGQRRTPAHELIASNLLTMHIHPLPTEGRPDHFTGVIGQLKVTGQASPSLVDVGEPVRLHFTVSGEGNFDYVRSPALADNPAWKAYVPSSKTSYLNESHTNAVKTFDQSIIPQKNGDLPLPTASFSYFDPVAKQYVTVPIPLPVITVTGSVAPIAAASSDNVTDATTAAIAPQTMGFLPNRLDIGSTRTSLAPVYRQPWFWAVQTGLVSLPFVAALLLYFRSRKTQDDDHAERALRRRFQQHEEDAMTEAARKGDAVAFFMAARHAVQLQLGAQWNSKPEAITLGEIRARDPQLAGTLEPLFTQADEVIYSGKASPNLDLAQWEQRVRTELLQPQPA